MSLTRSKQTRSSATQGIWSHAAIGFGVAVFTLGWSWIVYPLFAEDAVRKHYLKKGWTEIKGRN